MRRSGPFPVKNEGLSEVLGRFADSNCMTKTRDEVLVKALERCLAESGETELNQHRYGKWHESLPNRRDVPNQLAFGNAAEFVKFSKANGFPAIKAVKHSDVIPRVFMSNSQLLAVVQRFVSETGSTSYSAFLGWRVERVEEGEAIPSAVTIAKRFVGWSNALPVSDAEILDVQTAA